MIDGQKLAEAIKKEVGKEIVEKHLQPGLAIILIGDDPASHLYVKLKKKACQQVGIEFHKYYCSGQSCLKEVPEAIKFLNKDPAINAILIQLPLPKEFDENATIKLMDPKKDVDGFHPDQTFLTPGLAGGILNLIKSTKENLAGKKAVIVSNSPVFAGPIKKILDEQEVKTEAYLADEKNLGDKASQADILIVAVGRPNFITEEMVKQNSIVIDVGTNRQAGTIVGDVDFNSVKNKAGWLTPVPGGVGPMTIAMLLKNTVELTKKQKAKNF